MNSSRDAFNAFEYGTIGDSFTFRTAVTLAMFEPRFIYSSEFGFIESGDDVDRNSSSVVMIDTGYLFRGDRRLPVKITSQFKENGMRVKTRLTTDREELLR
jgi:hypothetical protein